MLVWDAPRALRTKNQGMFGEKGFEKRQPLEMGAQEGGAAVRASAFLFVTAPN